MFISKLKMLEYDKIGTSEGIDINKTNELKECMLCHYWYFLNKNFSYGPYLCDGCYNIVQKSISFKNILLFMLKKGIQNLFSRYEKSEAKKLMANSNLIDKEGIFLKKIILFLYYIKNG